MTAQHNPFQSTHWHTILNKLNVISGTDKVEYVKEEP